MAIIKYKSRHPILSLKESLAHPKTPTTGTAKKAYAQQKDLPVISLLR